MDWVGLLSDYKGNKVVGHGGGYDGMYSQVLLVPRTEARCRGSDQQYDIDLESAGLSGSRCILGW